MCSRTGPRVPGLGLYASFPMAMVISFVGGRPATMSAATGAVALVVAALAREHGVGELADSHRAWVRAGSGGP